MKDLLVLFRDSFFCPNMAFCSMSKALRKRPDWKTKVYVWKFRSCVQLRYRWQAIIYGKIL